MEDDKIHDRATTIIAAYVGINAVGVDELPWLIGKVYAGLRAELGSEAPAEPALAPTLHVQVPPTPRKLTPSEVRKSITDEALVCFECGKRVKSMRMHLRTHRISDVDYIAKWGLPESYPMTAPSYSRNRSAHSKRLHSSGKIGSKK